MYLRRAIKLGACVVVIVAVAGVAIAYKTSRVSSTEKFISCLIKHGWSFERKPFFIPRRLQLALQTKLVRVARLRRYIFAQARGYL